MQALVWLSVKSPGEGGSGSSLCCAFSLDLTAVFFLFLPVQSILVSGKPHLGTERLVKLLKNFRSRLQVGGAALQGALSK